MEDSAVQGVENESQIVDGDGWSLPEMESGEFPLCSPNNWALPSRTSIHTLRRKSGQIP